MAITRYVDDDYCASCANDGYTWGTDAFASISSATDAAWFGDEIRVNPGIYGGFTIHAGQDHLTVSGTDPDAVFVDGGGSTGITLLPSGEVSTLYPTMEGVTVQNLTLRNANPGILLTNGGAATDDPDVSDDRNVVVQHVLFYQDIANSVAVQSMASALWLRHNTLVANASGVTLVHSQPTGLTDNYNFLQDNLFVALPNAAPLPYWWRDDQSQSPGINLDNGFASENGTGADWQTTPSGTLMTIDNAKFLNVVKQVFRVLAGSAAAGGASDGKTQGYYNYRTPVLVDATFVDPSNVPPGRTLGVDAFSTIQDAIDSGAQRVLVDPGVYYERISLVNGVSIFGAGAAQTILAPPDAGGGFLLGVENAKEAQFALFTLAGKDTADGVKVSGEGEAELQRLVIRNMGTAITVTGSSALVTLDNDTLVSNENGVMAVSCGNFDLRNSILAFHQNTALSYQTSGCPSTRRSCTPSMPTGAMAATSKSMASAVDEPGAWRNLRRPAVHRSQRP